MSELHEARETDMLEAAIIAHYGNRCPKHADGCPTCEAWRQLDQLLARAACDVLGEGSDQFLKQLLREARVHWYHDLSIPSAAALELKLIVDAAIDAAREAQS